MNAKYHELEGKINFFGPKKSKKKNFRRAGRAGNFFSSPHLPVIRHHLANPPKATVIRHHLENLRPPKIIKCHHLENPPRPPK